MFKRKLKPAFKTFKIQSCIKCDTCNSDCQITQIQSGSNASLLNLTETQNIILGFIKGLSMEKQ